MWGKKLDNCDATDESMDVNIHDKGKMFTNAKAYILVLLYAITGCLGFVLLRNDFFMVLRWYIGIVIFGICVMPLCAYIFKMFDSKGYPFAKIIGVVVFGYFEWIAVNIKITKFGRISSIFIITIITAVIYCAAVAIISKKNGKGCKAFLSTAKEAACSGAKWLYKTAFVYELFFLLLLILISWLFGHHIPGVATERVMDYAILKQINITEYFPIADWWGAGEKFNYYYFGQYLTTYICKVCGVDVRVGYTLMLNTIYALGMILVFALVCELLRAINIRNVYRYAGGVLAATLTFVAGNGHYIVFNYIAPALWDILGISGDKPTYFYSNSSRYIGYQPVVECDKTIVEFPSYSLFVGDLHAHVIDILNVILILAVLYSFFLIKQDEKEKTICKILNPRLIFVGFLLSISMMSNYWDFPIYFVVCGSIILATNLYYNGIRLKNVLITLGEGALIFALIKGFALPFALSFDKMEAGIALVSVRSKLYQYLILWAIPIIVIAVFIYYLARFLKKKITIADIYTVFLGLCATGLTILPEFIYARDIYENGFPRANTMFKLSYEAFILFGITCAYAIVRILADAHNEDSKTSDVTIYVSKCRCRKSICVLLTLFVITLFYSVTAGKQTFGEFKDGYKGLDALHEIENQLNDEMKTVDWIRENVPINSVLLVADGDSYSMFGLIPAVTDTNTVLGWHWHEWLWHNSQEYMYDRSADVTELYTGKDMDVKRELIDRYNIDYIYVGFREYEKYGYVDIGLLSSLGYVVYSDNADDFPSVIIKVDKYN
ncbi:MAG: hypothetical protein KBT19_03400 [Lachnospiraceae bacterium]|nr:hypothetical protein [Candidatus Colinaster equi]